MPAWWGRKSSSSRKKEEREAPAKDRKSRDKARSFDDVFARNSPKSRDSGIGSASSLDSDALLGKQGHPLPRPSGLSALALVHDHGVISGSVSSVSSSGSSDDHPDHAVFGQYRDLGFFEFLFSLMEFDCLGFLLVPHPRSRIPSGEFGLWTVRLTSSVSEGKSDLQLERGLRLRDDFEDISICQGVKISAFSHVSINQWAVRGLDPINTPRGRCLKPDSQRQHQIGDNKHAVPSSPFLEHPRTPEIPASPRSEYQRHGSVTPPHGNAFSSPRSSMDIKFSPRSRSPAPVSRGHTRSPSPLHPQARSFSPESSMDKLEDDRNERHPLPLPPSSPTSPSSHALRTSGASENVQAQILRSKWKKGGKLLGRGTFGHVYVGFNSENGQMCAIKEVRVISDDRNSKESLRQLNQLSPYDLEVTGSSRGNNLLLRKEITMLSQLSHLNIVQYYGSELTDDTLSVYLEYVSGGSIHKLLQEYGPFKEPVIQSYTAQILSGLAYLHAKNTVHRKPEFVLLKQIKSCTSVLSFKGSPYWMAPEVIMNFSGYNLAVDIWSLGCTIIEMATSKPPWSQYEGVAAIFKIGNSKEIPEIPDYLSEDGKKFLRLCLQRDPSARPTAAQLLEHPFVRDQATAKFAKVNMNRDANHLSQSSNDGSYMKFAFAAFFIMLFQIEGLSIESFI
ncbi:hypothetical protein ACLOJK_013933 [Asimina triloba]